MNFRKLLIAVVANLSVILSLPCTALATPDLRNSPNNKVGIGILSPDSEIEEAGQLVNNKGDWGWVVVVIKSDERNRERWQGIFDQMAQNHLIPIVRIATVFDSSGYWRRPDDNDSREWADFLSSLYWPTKNKYVQVYNEVNRSTEWGGKVDPSDYARELAKTIKALKDKSEDFFILPSPLDLALVTSSNSLSADQFWTKMEEEAPGVLASVDGWASHSYPNPDFSSSPLKTGRLSIKGFDWEIAEVNRFLKGKDLPVFITETGWRRTNALDEEKIKEYYQIAFREVWIDKRVVAVAPFVLNYPNPLFNAFSFKTNDQVLGKKYYSYYSAIADLDKVRGEPEREDKAVILGDLPQTLIEGFEKRLTLKIKNAGNYVWSKNDIVTQVNFDGKISNLSLEKDRVFPGEETNIAFSVKPTREGEMKLDVQTKSNTGLAVKRTYDVTSVSLLSLVFNLIKTW